MVTTLYRSWKWEDSTEYGSNYLIKISTEVLTLDDTNIVRQVPEKQIIKYLSEVQDDPDVIQYFALKEKLLKKWSIEVSD